MSAHTLHDGERLVDAILRHRFAARRQPPCAHGTVNISPARRPAVTPGSLKSFLYAFGTSSSDEANMRVSAPALLRDRLDLHELILPGLQRHGVGRDARRGRGLERRLQGGHHLPFVLGAVAGVEGFETDDIVEAQALGVQRGSDVLEGTRDLPVEIALVADLAASHRNPRRRRRKCSRPRVGRCDGAGRGEAARRAWGWSGVDDPDPIMPYPPASGELRSGMADM